MQNSDYIPQPTKHKKGYAIVRLKGRDLYLGQHGSPEAKAKYTTSCVIQQGQEYDGPTA